ncbi:MAG: hypothetical protein RLZZ46_386 [Bacteroidota bacterium]|jgi:Fur family ferric uptake transcriptional regulator
MNDGETKEAVRKIFTEYLEKKTHRKTPERYAILEEIYSREGHFDIDSLFDSMKNSRFRVSRATLYNTMELLVDCQLVSKQTFGKNLAQFEKSYKYRQHDHLICNDCGKVFEFCDPRLQQIQNLTGEILNFSIKSHSLNFFGDCNQYHSKGSCENKKTS